MKSWIEHLVASRQVDTKPSGSIKVAVIDEGIDPRQEDLTGKIMAGVSFCQHPKFPSRISAYFVPAGHHGTMIARLICRLCPNVKLYIARIQELNGKRLITGQSATQVCAYKVLLFLNWSSIFPKLEDIGSTPGHTERRAYNLYKLGYQKYSRRVRHQNLRGSDKNCSWCKHYYSLCILRPTQQPFRESFPLRVEALVLDYQRSDRDGEYLQQGGQDESRFSIPRRTNPY
jgi:hypothetical protein